MAQSLTESQLETLVVIERTSAALSLTGTALVISTFWASKTFRTLSNTLIFYASFGNVLSNVAHLFAVAGVTAGPNSALCQMQGFLQQMFMPADSLWSLAMAGNVYLAFFHHYDSESLKKLHWRYFLVCYGVPFIPALIYLFVKNSKGERIYGGATLWCWIANDWAPLRIATYYGPIWFIMLFIFAIYIRVGKEIYKKRRELRSVYQTTSTEVHNTKSQIPNGAPYKEISISEPIHGTRTTEVHVVSNTRSSDTFTSTELKTNRTSPDTMTKSDHYSVMISSFPATAAAIKSASPNHEGKSHLGMDRVIMAYTKCAALFAASLLITWIPSSANRVYGLIYTNKVSYALNVASALVLPLQGFWNAVIYFVTSFAACRALCSSFGFRLPALGYSTRFLTNLGRQKRETDSTVELSTDLGARAFDSKDSC